MARVPLAQARTEFLAHCETRGLASSTVAGRRSALDLMSRVLGMSKPVNRITGADVDKVFATYAWSQGTRNNRVGQYKAFFAWCRARGYLPRDADPLYGWRMVTVDSSHRTRIPRDEWATLFDACQTTSEATVFGTGLYLFLRASEQQGIQLKHIHLSDSEIEIYRKKTRTWDTMPICLELDGYLRNQVEWLTSSFTTTPDTYLIPGRTMPRERTPGGQLKAGTSDYVLDKPFSKPHAVVSRVLSRAGYPTDREGEHTLRRSGARAYFDSLALSGYDGALRRVQSMLGHRSSVMTETYLGLDIDRQRRNFELRGHFMFPPITAQTRTEGDLSDVD